ncbi:hypothetical protein BURMUCF2_A1851 [Burkholderia multivorans CF2]|nr:hypothetical protein BURMUCF2_A1851 [Burkholderia multivorans CF2]
MPSLALRRHRRVTCGIFAASFERRRMRERLPQRKPWYEPSSTTD